jgi:hypothetical protein
MFKQKKALTNSSSGQFKAALVLQRTQKRAALNCR